MIAPGLCSITYRQCGIEQIVTLTAAAGLERIEWGGDVHVPPGDEQAARRARALTDAAGLQVASYGSYFRTGADEPFEPVLASAVALGAPRIRVWAGRQGSAEATATDCAALAERLAAFAAAAAPEGIEIGLEFHRGTLTDEVDSTLDLLARVTGNGQAVTTYWQPPVGMGDDDAAAGLERVLDAASTVHVFSWWPQTERLALSARASLWRRVFTTLGRTGRDHDALLEFVAGDDPEALATEAACLRSLIEGAE